MLVQAERDACINRLENACHIQETAEHFNVVIIVCVMFVCVDDYWD